MGARVPLDSFPLVWCRTGMRKYRHLRLEYEPQTLCQRVTEDFINQPSEHRPVCPECSSTARYLSRHKPEGQVDTLACLAR
jgi:hypothetical protein